MKTLLAVLLIILSLGVHAAGTATFSWNKPFPAFSAAVDPSWVIDEYRIKCTVDSVVVPDRVVLGYDAETVTYTDMQEGNTACHVVSFSVGAGLESTASNLVTQQVYSNTSPNPPLNFSF